MVRGHEGDLPAEEGALRQVGRMPVRESGGYHVGQHGWIDVLEGAGDRMFRVEGEIIRLIPTSDTAVYALIETKMGTGVYRVW